MTHRHGPVQHMSAKLPMDKAKRKRLQEELKKLRMPSNRGAPEVRDQPLLQTSAKRMRLEMVERSAEMRNKALHRHDARNDGAAAVSGGELRPSVRLDLARQPRLSAKFGIAPLAVPGVAVPPV